MIAGLPQGDPVFIFQRRKQMGRLLFCSLFTAVVLFLSLSSVVYSDTFTDTFDDPSFTDSNWTTYATGAQQTWSHTTISGTDSGYHASALGEDPVAAKLANSGAEYASADLVIETLVRLYSHPENYTAENMVGVAFPFVPQNPFYHAGIEQDYDRGTDTIFFSMGIDGEENFTEMPVDITFDTFYKLVVHMDSTMQITAWLFSLDGTLMGTLSMGNILSLQRGAVAIYGGPEVSFNNFKINDSGSIPLNHLTKNQVSQLYVSIFGRASEGEGNAYWQNQPDMATAASAMLDTDAAKNYFGANLNTNQAFIEHIYLNTLNKTIADDFPGISYWVNLLDTGTSRGEAVRTLVGAIKDYAPGGPYYNPDDAATVEAHNQFVNRVEVSDYMADNVYAPPDDWETSTSFSYDMVVTDDPATVFAAMVVVNGFTDEPVLPGPCGAYIAHNVWKEFDCYNLAAIGKATGADPFTPSWELIGGYWQWSRKGPDSSQWYDTNTEHFAHGPTGPGLGEANDAEIIGWDQTYAPDVAWSDSYKTPSDPCPDGFRVPSVAQWDGVLENNHLHSVGTWSTSAINYSSALFYGDNLMLPAAGGRNANGALWTDSRGGHGYYWSAGYEYTPWGLYFGNSGGATDNAPFNDGFSVRCVAEDISDKNIILRVVHVTEDWMPYASIGGWTNAVKAGYKESDDEWTEEKYDETNVELQYHNLFSNKSNLKDVLIGRIDLKRKAYEYSINNMIENKVEQGNYLYSCSSYNDFKPEFEDFISGRNDYTITDDLLNYLQRNNAPKEIISKFHNIILYSADNKDFFTWEIISNGLLMDYPN
jgi:hypothetical protein